MKSSTFYDHADRPVESYGPAPASYYGGDNRPNNAGPVPYGTTRYDESMTGLQAAYWAVGAIVGPPKMHGAEAGAPHGVYDLNWGAGGPAGLGVTDNWGMRLTGEVTIPSAGNYEMQMYSDSAVRLWVDDVLISDGWGDPQGGLRQASLGYFNNTVAGSRHRIRIDFVDVGGNAHMYMMWKAPGQPAEVVPNSLLSPRLGLVTSSTSPEGRVSKTNYQYPYLGLATQQIADHGGLGLTTSTGYEAPGVGFLRRTSRTLPAGNSWSYTYYGNTESRANPCVSGSPSVSQAGFLKSSTAPDPDGSGSQSPRITEQVYDNSGRVVASRVNTESWSCVTYDSRGRTLTRTIPAFGGSPTRTTTNTYSVGGNPAVSTVSDATGTISTGLDWIGRVISYSDVWNKTTTSTYDQPGRLVSTSSPKGTETFTYDPAGRPMGQSLDGLAMATATYDNSGQLVGVVHPSGTPAEGDNSTGVFAYDAYGRHSATTWKQTDKETTSSGSVSTETTPWTTSDAVTYDIASGRVVDQVIDGVDAFNGNNFTYDGVGRLTNAKVAGHDLSYQYSSSGGCGTLATAGANTNRTATIDNGVTKTNCYDNADRLMSNPSDPTIGTVTYDSHGNTTELGRTLLSYDGSDRHLKSTVGDQVVTYKRDATDRIVERSVVEPEIVTRRGLPSSATSAALTVSSL
ncbi:MAG: PA14 domain-containing protein, partial [Acidimicrobiales bacterium]